MSNKKQYSIVSKLQFLRGVDGPPPTSSPTVNRIYLREEYETDSTYDSYHSLLLDLVYMGVVWPRVAVEQMEEGATAHHMTVVAGNFAEDTQEPERHKEEVVSN